MKKIVLGHSPDPDDAFLTYAIVKRKVEHNFVVDEFIAEIEVLNKLCIEHRLDISAVSAYTFLKICDKYMLIPYGASVGYGYGPKLLLRKTSTKPALIAVPGFGTTARALVELYLRQEEKIDYKLIELPYDKVLDAFNKGLVDGCVLIHEEQLLSFRTSLEVDLGRWWFEKYRKPIPLGLNIIKKELEHIAQDIVRLFEKSIQYALNNTDEVLEYAMKYSRIKDRESIKKFVLMYVKQNRIHPGTEEFDGLLILQDKCLEHGLLETRYTIHAVTP